MQLTELIKECRKGSVTAQKYLFDAYAKPFFLICRRYMKTQEQAEEMMMNGFLKIFEALPQFEYKNEAATVGWMKRILINECLQELRRKNSFLFIAEEYAEEISAAEDVIEKMEADEIYRLILQLPPGYRTVFNLYVIEQMSHREIAAALSITEGTSKSQLSKARNMLQHMITQQNNYVRKVQ